MSPDLLTFVIFVGVALTLGMFALVFLGDASAKRAAQRLEALRERHTTNQAARAQAQMKRIYAQRDTRLDSLVNRFLPNPAQLRARLERTGRSWTLGQYALACVGIAVVTAVVLVFIGLPILLAVLIGVFASLFLPHIAVGILIKRRLAAFTTRFPDAIELIVRGLRSGLPITESLGVVGREIPDPVGIEYRQVTDKIRIGQTMDQTLQEMGVRINTPEFQFFVITLSIQRETGGNLAETLSNLADVLRKRAQMKLKIRAMSSEAKASAYILGVLPFVIFTLIYMINPGYIGVFFTETRMMMIGSGAVVWMATGAFIMSRMINFEI